MKKNRIYGKFEVSISNFAISTKQEPHIPVLANGGIINWTYTPKAKSWNIRINAEVIVADKTYREFAAMFADCIRDLKISDFSFYNMDIELDSHALYAEKDIRLNLLMINLFNIAINETGEGKGSGYYRTYENCISVGTANNYWSMNYYSNRMGNADMATTGLTLKTYKPTRKGGYAPRELKKLWFKKLDQIPVIYEYLKIRKYNAGEDYIRNKDLMKEISLSDLKAYIRKIEVAMNEYFGSKYIS